MPDSWEATVCAWDTVSSAADLLEHSAFVCGQQQDVSCCSQKTSAAVPLEAGTGHFQSG